MREIPAALALHLAEGVTTLCRCWRLTRRDGVALGFTDHDRDLVVAGQLYAAGSGLEAAEATSELGFAVGGGEVSGALSSPALTEADIAAGLYDDATVETRLVNWASPDGAMLLEVSSIGEIRRADDAFVAELRGPMHRLDEERGRRYRAACSADLGDERCRVDLGQPGRSATGTVATTDGALTLTTGDLGAFAAQDFAGGRLRWTSGANAGVAVEIKLHRVLPAGQELVLWERAPSLVAAGDGFAATVGCDKRLATCRDRFANTANFRGFPHMPGNDFVLKLAAQGEPGLDGGSLFR